MILEGNPFSWGFSEEHSFDTLATRGKATYNKPREIVEQGTAMDGFFVEQFGTSPNPAFITGMTAIDPLPFGKSEVVTEDETVDTNGDNNITNDGGDGIIEDDKTVTTDESSKK